MCRPHDPKSATYGGTKLQQADHWLEKAIELEAIPDPTEFQIKALELSLKNALKLEAEYFYTLPPSA